MHATSAAANILRGLAGATIEKTSTRIATHDTCIISVRMGGGDTHVFSAAIAAAFRIR